ncbi:hypothetical protein AB0G79_20180 [Streptomyces sp. NPDC020807]|uniref:zinc finger domain-containing protein n=1 Tax=Streptomyces sp. NPDC020807 TaxID=3155119 RepID=UPI00340E825A
MPVEMASNIARFLATGTFPPDEVELATAHAAQLRELLRPHCGFGYAYSRYPSQRQEGCSIAVDDAGQRCEEHSTWPRWDGSDPDPERCPGIPLHGEGTTWVAEGAAVRVWGETFEANESTTVTTTRCPYPRRPDGSPCPLHDPRPEDLCGWGAADGEEACTEITALYGCPHHRLDRLAAAGAEIRLSVSCPQCNAAAGSPCTGRPEAYNGNVHAARRKKTEKQVEEIRRSLPSAPPLNRS